MAAYLDSIVFEHLYSKTGCTSAGIADLRKKIYGRQLSIPVSIHTLEEILLDRRARPELLVAKTKLTLSLGSFRRMVKPCDQLLLDDLRAYAATGEAARPFIDANLQNVLADGLSALVETDGEDRDEEMMAAFEEAARRKEKFRRAIKAGLEDFQSPATSPDGASFEQYYEVCARPLLEKVLARLGVVAECQQRGIGGLLQLKSVRMIVGATLSFLYARTVDSPSFSIGESIDLHHALCAAAVADTFVTDDEQLRRILSRVPLDHLAIADLPTFLQTVRD